MDFEKHYVQSDGGRIVSIGDVLEWYMEEGDKHPYTGHSFNEYVAMLLDDFELYTLKDALDEYQGRLDDIVNEWTDECMSENEPCASVEGMRIWKKSGYAGMFDDEMGMVEDIKEHMKQDEIWEEE